MKTLESIRDDVMSVIKSGDEINSLESICDERN